MSQRLAIISSGPSASLFEDTLGRIPFDHVAGVNGMVTKYHCNWWVFVDWWTYLCHDPIGCPDAFVPQSVPLKLELRGREVIDRDLMPDGYHPGISEETFNRRMALWPQRTIALQDNIEQPQIRSMISWNCYSGLAALGLISLLPDINHVICFGVDLTGEDGADGLENNSRNENRWLNERKAWNALVDYYTARDIIIERWLL